ncbi:MAG: hypothetical protein EOS30_06540 [Mesorhizobium sp.]|nr:hypothetical protein EN746_01275 [Mesorhizobium sp. M8A.F.Ca.ET.023.02.2.1]RWC78805.1 MAG: hypothetical protein EOS30_06540 [Mesorhizobium sp.]
MTDTKISKDEAIELLARHLHMTMERFDPEEENLTWEKLAPFEQEVRRGCVRELLKCRSWIDAALHPNSR